MRSDKWIIISTHCLKIYCCRLPSFASFPVWSLHHHHHHNITSNSQYCMTSLCFISHVRLFSFCFFFGRWWLPTFAIENINLSIFSYFNGLVDLNLAASLYDWKHYFTDVCDAKATQRTKMRATNRPPKKAPHRKANKKKNNKRKA